MFIRDLRNNFEDVHRAFNSTPTTQVELAEHDETKINLIDRWFYTLIECSLPPPFLFFKKIPLSAQCLAGGSLDLSGQLEGSN